MKKAMSVKITKRSFSVCDVDIPASYLEGHAEKFAVLCSLTLLTPNFDPEVNSIYFIPGADGVPGPNGEPGGKGGRVNFLMKGELFMQINNKEITVRGEKVPDSEPEKFAIRVYSHFREFIDMHVACVGTSCVEVGV